MNDKLRFNKWGRIKIAYELQKRNIPAPIRSEALEGIDEKEYADILQSLLKAKKKSTKGKTNGISTSNSSVLLPAVALKAGKHPVV